MTKNLRNLSDSDLFVLIDDLAKTGHASFFGQCEALYELYKRGVNHPLHKPKGKHLKAYAHFENVALGRLTPEIVAYFGGHPGKLAKFTSYGPEHQKIAAADRPFTIAVIDPESGEIVKGEKIVRKMTAIELDFAFPGNGHLATFIEQAAKLEALMKEHPAAVAPVSRVAVHTETSIKVRGNIVTMDELAKVLSEMGYSVTKN